MTVPLGLGLCLCLCRCRRCAHVTIFLGVTNAHSDFKEGKRFSEYARSGSRIEQNAPPAFISGRIFWSRAPGGRSMKGCAVGVGGVPSPPCTSRRNGVYTASLACGIPRLSTQKTAVILFHFAVNRRSLCLHLACLARGVGAC